MKLYSGTNKLISSILPSIIMATLLAFSIYFNVVSAKEPARVIAGWVEKVRIDKHNFDVKAKLDTGARTSSIHAKNIKSFKKDGERWVRFTLILNDSRDKKHQIKMEKPRSRRTNIKNHNGEHDKRHVVDFDICFNGNVIEAEFTLADRREYIYDVLLGRQFLKQTAIVDPKRIFLTTAKCE